MSEETKIGRYIIEAPLGEGAMGSVYRATDPMIKRVVAIKKIRLDQVTSQEEADEFKQRLFQEAQISGILLHPNIVVVYDVGEEDGLPFIAMEYVEGTTLQDLMKAEGPLEHGRIAGIVGQISSGLQYAHQHNIIHRDIKPQNIMVAKSGEAKIMDFGIAKFIDTHMTKTGIFLGTPAYSSPEQIKGEDTDYRSDIFSLGVLAHELLTHKPPFPGASINTILYNVAHGLPQIDDTLKGISNGGITLESVFLKVLEKDPTKRYQSATEFSSNFRYALGFAESSTVQATSAGVPIQGTTPSPVLPPTPVSPPAPAGDWNQPTVRMENQPKAPQAPAIGRRDPAHDPPSVPEIQPEAKTKSGSNLWVMLASILGVAIIATIVTMVVIKSKQSTQQADPDPQIIRQTVAFQSTPPNASVFLNSKKIGDTPFSFEFKEDTYELIARLEGHESVIKTIEVPLYDPNVSLRLKPLEEQQTTGPTEDDPVPDDNQTNVADNLEDSDDSGTNTQVADPVVTSSETPTEAELDQRDWDKAQNANSERSFRRYLNAHPQGLYAPDARGRIMRLRVRREYQKAMKSTSEADLEAFLDRYSSSQYADDVRTKLTQLRFSKKYKAALAANSPQELDSFLKANLHRLSDSQVAGIRAAQENLAFQRVIGTNDAAAFKRYLDVYKGIDQGHSSQVQEKLDQIKNARQAFLNANVALPTVKKKTRIGRKKDFLVDYELNQSPEFRLLETTIAWRLGDAAEQNTTLRRNGPRLNGAIPNKFLSSGTLTFRLVLKDVDGLVYEFAAQSTEISK